MKKYFLFAVLLLSGAALFTACEDDDEDDVLVEGIPADKDADPNPIVNSSDVNTVLPNLNYTVSVVNNHAVIRLDMTGVRDPYTKDWLRLYGTGDRLQNVWIEIDSVPKGFSISNTIDELANQPDPAVDLVFLVDNSTSMDDEADAIAADIIEWSQQLSKTLDVRFGCVGYGGFVSGAINLTTAAELEKWLTEKDWRTNVDGVWRTRGFVGPDAAKLEEAANLPPSKDDNDTFYRVVSPNYYTYTDWGDPDDYECGVMALRYANDLFSFRTGANRVYVNLTDEPNQPHGYNRFSTEWVKENWTPTQGTIHTVYTRSASYGDSSSYNYYENNIGNNYPWDLSVYTDGTMLFTNSDFRDSENKLVKLSDLPVSGALQNSYIIRFTKIEDLFDNKTHEIHMTVKSNSSLGQIIADKRFKMLFQR